MADEWRDPQTVHAYNLSLLFGGRPVIATQIAPCFQKDLLLYSKAWPTAPKKKKKASIRLHGVIFVRRMKWNVFHLLGVILEGMQGWVLGGGCEESVNFSHQSSSDINNNRNLESITKNKQRPSRRVCSRALRRRQRLCKPE